jgi:cytochrome c peroxidase
MAVRFLLGLLVALTGAVLAFAQGIWSPREWQTIRSMHLRELGAVPKDPSNRFADNLEAAKLGHKLFFDVRLSGNGEVSCASCHNPKKGFTDQLVLAEGMATTKRNTPSVVGSAHNSWFFWDGRADSQWAQALGPLESAAEHGTNRIYVAGVISEFYPQEYENIFGTVSWDKLPSAPDASFDAAEVVRVWEKLTAEQKFVVNTIFVNVGKSLAAYQRNLDFGKSRFETYIENLETTGESQALSSDELAGLKLFIGEANCIACHSGANFSDQGFHNIGLQRNQDLLAGDAGREGAAQKLAVNEFNCLGEFSDDRVLCLPLSRLKTDLENEVISLRLNGAFKTPSLRNVAQTFPYMHAGQFMRLQDVLKHYNSAPRAEVGTSELKALNLSPQQLQQLESFLKSLSAPPNAPAELLESPFK